MSGNQAESGRSPGEGSRKSLLRVKYNSGKYNMEGRTLPRHAFDFYAPSIVVANALDDGKPYAQTFTLR
jgi:hypothetical protein